MNCSVCSHPDHQAIDQALIAGSATLAALCKQYNLSTSALSRHKAHLQAKVGRAKSKLLDYLQQHCLLWLSQTLEMTFRTAQAAEAEGNGKLVIQAVSQGARLVNIIMKHDLPLDDRLVYKIITSPQWTSQAGIWPDDPEIMASQRQVLAEAFTVPCPDTETDAQSSVSQEDLSALQALFSTLAQPSFTQPNTANHQPKAENRSFQKREKSGKILGKVASPQIINKDIPVVKSDEKNTGKNCPSWRLGSLFDSTPAPGAWIQELDAGRLSVDTLNAIGAGRLPEPPTDLAF
jgi:hypothetical protein